MSAPSQKLLDAVTAILVEDGFEGVSVRKVATRAGVSIGAVQHHFPTKDVMLTAAMDRASEQFRRRLAERVPLDSTAEEALFGLCSELLGARPDQRSTSVLWVARLARAEVDVETGRAHAREWAELAELAGQLLQAVRPQWSSVAVQDSAAALLALLDGLAVSILREPGRMPADRAERILSDHLAALLG